MQQMFRSAHLTTKQPAPGRRGARALMAGVALMALAACEGNGLDWDLRDRASGLNTAEAARQVTASRPAPDSRGVISYPNYQVAVARNGESVADVARRLDLSAGELARYNALEPDTPLRSGELLALPERVAARPTGTATDGGIDITSLASGAIDRAEGERGREQGTAATTDASSAREPVRHRVERGETAFSIARLYNVTTRSLADWNGLGPDMTVREGQYLLIPVPDRDTPQRTAAAGPRADDSSAPGAGTPTPTPPSASRPLPDESAPAASEEVETPPSPDMAEDRTEASGTSRLAMPVQGNIIRDYDQGRNDGIGIAASAGTQVRAAGDGTVAAITRDTDQVPILVIRHEDNLLTIYANIDNIQVERGTRVSRGDTVATVRAGNPAFLHFEVRQGFESVDPMPFLQ